MLGYRLARKALYDHVEDDDKKGVPIQNPLGGKQEMTIINESGLYSLILSSKLPQAKEFKRWVTSEVLPQIRKTGAYLTQDFCMRVLNAEGTVTTTQIAQDYGMTAQDFNEMLADMKIQYRCGRQWILYSGYKQQGFVQSATTTYTRYDGTKGVRVSSRWTQLGRIFLYERLKGEGVMPIGA